MYLYIRFAYRMYRKYDTKHTECRGAEIMGIFANMGVDMRCIYATGFALVSFLYSWVLTDTLIDKIRKGRKK